jgi:hypothetical protein
MSYGQGIPQPPNSAPGQYGNPPPPQYGGSAYGGSTPGSPSGGGTTYGSAPTSGGTYGGGPPYGGPPQQQGTNGLSIAGLVLAFLFAPLGLILSIVGLIQAGKRGQKGKGLAIGGIIVSLLVMIASGVLIVAAASTVSKLVDPGCTTGKAAILDNAAKAGNSSTAKEGLQATIAGLNSAAAKAQHSDVRDAMKALADDYSLLVQDINTATVPDDSLENKITADANKIDSLCSIGTK